MTKTIFITGASSGMGKATAKLFAAKGWKVIATMRKPELETELTLLDNVTVLQLDVTKPEQIKEATEKALVLGPIDIVFNNAGYPLLGALEATTDEQITRQMDTNFLGVVRVTQAFIPYFRTKGTGLFINMTSSAGLAAFPFSSMYDASKWALEGWSESLSFELGLFGISIKNIEPGMVSTDMAKNLESPAHPAYDAHIAKFFAAIGGSKYSTPEEIAEVVYEAATDGTDRLRYVCGDDAKALYARRLEVGTEVFTKEIKQMIFGA